MYHDGNKSNNFLIPRGVPKDPILASLLYSIYSKYLLTKLKFCNVQMYANDVQLYTSCLPFDITNYIGKIDSNPYNVFQKMSANGVWLNPSKTKALIIA